MCRRVAKISDLAARDTSGMQHVFLLVHPKETLIAVFNEFNAAAISDMPVLTMECWNQALCLLDVFGCISVYGCTNVFCVSVCRLCESWSSIRTQVGATRDCEMPPDSE